MEQYFALNAMVFKIFVNVKLCPEFKNSVKWRVLYENWLIH